MVTDRMAREDVREVLAGAGVHDARRATSTDPTEEVILLQEEDYRRVDVEALTRALMDVLPHVKVWVVADTPQWISEAI
jgi:hypothetical protein